MTPAAVTTPASALDNYLVCQCCQGSGVVKQTHNYVVRDAECSQCGGEGLIWRGQGKRPPTGDQVLTAKKRKGQGDEACLEGDYALALSHYSAALKEDESLVEALNNRSLANYALEDFKNAADDASKVIEQTTDDTILHMKALLRRGLARARLNDEKQRLAALDDLAAILKLQPGHPLALETQTKLTTTLPPVVPSQEETTLNTQEEATATTTTETPPPPPTREEVTGVNAIATE